MFDQTCWDELSQYPEQTENRGLICPICRAPVQQETASTTLSTATMTSASWDTYRQERQFRVRRLRERYPDRMRYYYTTQWDSNDYSGSMMSDYQRHCREEERREAAQRAADRRAHQASNSRSRSSFSTSSFGGGSADGGGVGGSW